jgi:hypothetical protein
MLSPDQAEFLLSVAMTASKSSAENWMKRDFRKQRRLCFPTFDPRILYNIYISMIWRAGTIAGS